MLIYSDWLILGCALRLVFVPIKCALIMNFVNFYEIILEIEYVEGRDVLSEADFLKEKL